MKRWGCSDRQSAIARARGAIRRSRRNGNIRTGVWSERLNPVGLFGLEGRTLVCVRSAGRTAGFAWSRSKGSLLVSYRHMYVREIDLRQRCTRALVLSRDVD